VKLLSTAARGAFAPLRRHYIRATAPRDFSISR